jgi:lactate dehydrogenase-like 2-hydroxyacid dehydrogenase
VTSLSISFCKYLQKQRIDFKTKFQKRWSLLKHLASILTKTRCRRGSPFLFSGHHSFRLKLRCDMEKVRFGIIGIGNIGTVHARYLLAGTVKDAC